MKPSTWCMLATAAALMGGGCASTPDTRFYTLAEPAASSAEAGAGAAAPFHVDVLPVAVPERLARPQLVVHSRGLDGTGLDGQVFVLEHDRWAAPFDQELRDAFAAALADRVGASGALAPDRPVYRVAIELDRFDAIAGDRVKARFRWTVADAAGGAGATCQVALTERADGGIGGVVRGVRRAVAATAVEISRNLEDLGAGRPATCAPRSRQIDPHLPE